MIMTNSMRALVILGGLIGGIFAVKKVNEKYAEKHDGETWTHHMAEEIEQHPLAATLVGCVGAVAIGAVAKDIHDANLPRDYYQMKQAIAEAKVKQREIDLKNQREREEAEEAKRMKYYELETQRLAIQKDAEEKKRQDQLNYDRQMPPEYWLYKASEQDRMARETIAEHESDTIQYISDNATEAAKEKWRSKVEIAKAAIDDSEDEEDADADK